MTQVIAIPTHEWYFCGTAPSHTDSYYTKTRTGWLLTHTSLDCMFGGTTTSLLAPRILPAVGVVGKILTN